MRNIELDQENLFEVPFDKVRYIAIGCSGAMGEAGGVFIVTDDKQTYHGNYCTGHIKYSDLKKAFPPLEKFDYLVRGDKSKGPKDWNFVDLGCGNSLFVHSEVYPWFAKQIEGLESYEIYAGFDDIVLR